MHESEKLPEPNWWATFVIFATLFAFYLIWRSEHSKADEIASVTKAAAELLGAVAWPGAVALGFLLFPTEVRSLLRRLREFPGGKLDPHQPQRPAPPEGDVATALRPAEDVPVVTVAKSPGPYRSPPVERASPAGPTAALEAVRGLRSSAEVRAMEQTITAAPQVQGAAEHEKVEVLTIMAAVFFVSMQHQRIDLTIWASQLRALEALKAAPDGIAADTIRQNYFEPAAAIWEGPKKLGWNNWQYFLVQSLLMRRSNNVMHITDRGRDYLSWRDRTRQPPVEFN